MEALSRLPSRSVITKEVGALKRWRGSAMQNQSNNNNVITHFIFFFRELFLKRGVILMNGDLILFVLRYKCIYSLFSHAVASKGYEKFMRQHKNDNFL